MKHQVPQFIRWFFPGTIWRLATAQPSIYITFDDGPVPEVTPQVLEILDKYQVKATFFCVGENVARYPTLFGEVLAHGHAVGNHSYNHLRGTQTSTQRYVENFEKADTLIKSPLMRPPYGRITPAQRRILSQKYKIIMWDYITYDFDARYNAQSIMRDIKKYSRNGSIVIFHDSIKASKNMLEVLPLAIEYWQSQGYKIEAIRL
jgi:peptidoglycan/xylan/chitin deacetylase (PgdA/CDA1 family)